MKRLVKHRRVERWAGWWERCEARVNARLRRLNDYLRVKTDRFSWRVKWIGLIVFVVAATVLCSVIIYIVFK